MKDSQQDVETMAAALRGKIGRGQDQTQSPPSLNLPPPLPAAKMGRKSVCCQVYKSTEAARESYTVMALPQLSLCTRAPALYVKG